MNNQLESAFREAFSNWEPPVSDAAIQADWSQLASKIQAPNVSQPTANAGAGAAPQAASSSWLAGAKLWIVGGLATAAITTAVVLSINTDANPTVGSDKSTPTSSIAPNSTLPFTNSESAEETMTLNGEVLPSNSDLPSSSNYSLRKPNNTKGFKRPDYIPTGPATVSSSGTGPAASSSTSRSSETPPASSSTPSATPSEIDFSAVSLAPGSQVVVGQELTLSGVDTRFAIILWGDGSSANSKLKHKYKAVGVYTIQVQSIADPSQKWEKSLHVVAIPSTSFTVNQLGDRELAFQVLKPQAGQDFTWYFGDGNTLSGPNTAQHRYADTGVFHVRLATTLAGYTRDTIVEVYVASSLEPTFYNVFTPNGDALNDFWKPTMPRVSNYELNIYDERGRLVFTTLDPAMAWNGLMFNKGEPLPDGKYLFKLSYRNYKQSSFLSRSGSISLKR